jgi:hypothetical protein
MAIKKGETSFEVSPVTELSIISMGHVKVSTLHGFGVERCIRNRSQQLITFFLFFQGF